MTEKQAINAIRKTVAVDTIGLDANVPLTLEQLVALVERLAAAARGLPALATLARELPGGRPA